MSKVQNENESSEPEVNVDINYETQQEQPPQRPNKLRSHSEQLDQSQRQYKQAILHHQSFHGHHPRMLPHHHPHHQFCDMHADNNSPILWGEVSSNTNVNGFNSNRDSSGDLKSIPIMYENPKGSCNCAMSQQYDTILNSNTAANNSNTSIVSTKQQQSTTTPQSPPPLMISRNIGTSKLMTQVNGPSNTFLQHQQQQQQQQHQHQPSLGVLLSNNKSHLRQNSQKSTSRFGLRSLSQAMGLSIGGGDYKKESIFPNSPGGEDLANNLLPHLNLKLYNESQQKLPSLLKS